MILVVGAAGEKVRMSKEVGMSLLLHYRRERESNACDLFFHFLHFF